MTPIRVYGIRKCAFCKGICHENSYRENYGKRKRYYCSAHCVNKHEQAYGSWSYDVKTHSYTYEQVDVISR